MRTLKEILDDITDLHTKLLPVFGEIPTPQELKELIATGRSSLEKTFITGAALSIVTIAFIIFCFEKTPWREEGGYYHPGAVLVLFGAILILTIPARLERFLSDLNYHRHIKKFSDLIQRYYELSVEEIAFLQERKQRSNYKVLYFPKLEHDPEHHTPSVAEASAKGFEHDHPLRQLKVIETLSLDNDPNYIAAALVQIENPEQQKIYDDFIDVLPDNDIMPFYSYPYWDDEVKIRWDDAVAKSKSKAMAGY